MVRRILGINAVVFVAHLVSSSAGFWDYLALVPSAVFQYSTLWMIVTYMYVHFDLMHLLFNALGIWFFGPDIERILGGKRFFYYYTACGLGGALAACVGYPNSVIIGASGALYGLLVAFAVHFPYRPVLLFGVAPIESRWLAVLYGLISVVGGIQGTGGTAHLAHLGGLITGLAIFAGAGKFKSAVRRPSLLKRLVSAVQPQPRRRKEPDDAPLSDAELDAILDKISKSGMNSLSQEERRRLKSASARFRK
ncbi:rhomboid family intramembrane serine protease [bacterium]|nr:rhomboid family intramembrane serine protease [bacterium]